MLLRKVAAEVLRKIKGRKVNQDLKKNLKFLNHRRLKRLLPHPILDKFLNLGK